MIWLLYNLLLRIAVLVVHNELIVVNEQIMANSIIYMYTTQHDYQHIYI